MTANTPVICPSCHHQQGDQDAGFCASCRFPLMLIAGKYRLLRKLGEGGFGYVYLAEHVRLLQEAERVVKIIKPQVFLLDPSMAVRFEREVQMTSLLSQKCQHIVRIYDDFGEIPKLGHFYVMEYLQGSPVSAYIHDVPELPPLSWCIHVFGQLCDAMRRAHEMDIVHRDLKPDNLMLVPYGDEPNFLKVLDFGIAKPTDDINPDDPGSQPMNITQGLLGTPKYMAPELFGDQAEIDFRVDLYAMGIILYEMLAGRPPFVSEGRGPQAFFRMLSSHLSEPPPSLRALRPDRNIPQALEDAIMCALAKEPEDRFPSALAFKEAVFHAVGHSLDGRSLSIPSIPTPPSHASTSRSGGVMVEAPARQPTPQFTPAGNANPFERSPTPLPSLQPEERTALLRAPRTPASGTDEEQPAIEPTAVLKLPDDHPLRQPSMPSESPLAPMTPTPSHGPGYHDEVPKPTRGLPGIPQPAPGSGHTPFPSLQPPSVASPHTPMPSSAFPAATPPPGMPASTPSQAAPATDAEDSSKKQRTMLLGIGGLIGGLALAAFVMIFFQSNEQTKPPPTKQRTAQTPAHTLPDLPPPNQRRKAATIGNGAGQPSWSINSQPLAMRPRAPQAQPTQPRPQQPQVQPTQPQAAPTQPQPAQPIRPLPIRPLPIRPLPIRRRKVQRRRIRRRRRYVRRYRRRQQARPRKCPSKRQGIKWHPLRVNPSRASVRLQTSGAKEIMRLRGRGRYCLWFQSHIATLVVSRPGYKDCSIKLRRLPRRLNLKLRKPGDDTDRRDYCSF